MKKYTVLTFILLVIFGCSSDLDLSPVDSQSELNFWKTDEDARIFLNSMYADLMDDDTYLFLSALSDDAYSKGREDYRNIASGNYDPSNSVVTGFWSSRYEAIRRTNIFFNNVDNVTDITETNRTAYKGQGRFIRAWHYFYLIELYGDVPLVRDEISIEQALVLTRTPKQEVVDFIYSELEQAIEELPQSYPATESGRITKGAAIAFKARVHLYNEDYAQAAALSEQLIGQYSLFGNYANLFKQANEVNPEVILSLQYIPTNREHDIQYSLIPPSLGGYANFSPLQELVDTYTMINGLPIDNPASGYNELNPYANRDPRLSASIIRNGTVLTNFSGAQVTITTTPGSSPDGINFSSNSTPTGYYVNKFYDNQARNQIYSGTNLILIRYAEVLLNYAEAKIALGTFSQADWDLTIGAIRQRAGLAASALQYPGGTQADLTQLVRNERRVELAFEAGHRFFDIRRWRIAEDVLNGWAHGIKTDLSPEDNGYTRVDFRTFNVGRHYLWPIPLSERDINPNLSQNPNW
ncbi:RagB/SusD family nutrient uptake outer membrane protein [Flavobacterium sp. RHBU_24]|uniref:RagB/SusD family nutrient uptake outer membrane protein n=1 Tax=Flavobacterium sp. RHBU_24 TaxID=3391185 RepID=UPI003984CF88